MKDIENPDSEIVNTAHILFIDINGVGLKMQIKDEDWGLTNYFKKNIQKNKLSSIQQNQMEIDFMRLSETKIIFCIKMLIKLNLKK